MTYTTPRTWVALEIVSASVMNTHVRDNFNFLSGMKRAAVAISALADGTELAPYSPSVSVYRSADLTFADSSTQTIDFNSEFHDTHAYHDNATNPSRLTVPADQAGKYYIFMDGYIFYSGQNRTGFTAPVILKNGAAIKNARHAVAGAQVGGTDTSSGNMSVHTAQILAVADYIQFQAYYDTDGVVNFSLVGGATGVNAGMFRMLA